MHYTATIYNWKEKSEIKQEPAEMLTVPFYLRPI